MKVRWSSTFIMLTRAESRRQVCATHTDLYCILTSCSIGQAIDEFVLELGLKESNSEKQRKITSLALTSEEWSRVRLFCNILQVTTRLSTKESC
jgi:ABC-type cobalamin transport system ATPase subunit